MQDLKCYKLLILVAFGLGVRSMISLHSYSGQDKSPMFGDFEAQRHWQEVTVNLPTRDWYQNTTDNDLMYWGLDYPPLTAYHSFLVGKIAEFIDPSFVSLHASRGISTEPHKNFMRLTVLAADLFIYIPALLIACQVICKKVLRMNFEKSENFFFLFVALALLHPGQILIDNGHFQYNNISLGFFILAVSGILNGSRILGSVFFVLALNYKQMELYHAVPVFIYLLNNCFRDPDNDIKYGFFRGISRLIGLGLVVVLSFGVIWSPWLLDVDSLLQVVHRIFPVARGLFEDKVSNVWCIVNIFMKIKETYTNEEMLKICLIATQTALVPSSIHLLIKPSRKKFLYALINSSLAFFLFSFQVHEKSILLATVPAILVFPMEPFMVYWFLQVATFSMFPLLVKDGLFVAFAGSSLLYFGLTKFIIDNVKGKKLKDKNFLTVLWNVNKTSSGGFLEKIMVSSFVLSTVAEVLLIIGFFFVTPPAHLPFLHPVLVSAFSCCHFVMFFLYFNVKQIFY